MIFKTDFKDEIVSGGKTRQIIDANTGGVIHEKVLIENNYIPDQKGDRVTALWMNEVGKALNNMIDLLYPVGSVITNGRKDFDPNTLYPGTTWKRIKGRVIVGVDEDQKEFETVGKTGGSKEMQSHTHTGSSSSAGSHTHTASSNSTGSHTHTVSGTAASAGGHQHDFRMRIDATTGSYYADPPTSSKSGSQHLPTGAANPVLSGGAHTHTVTGTAASVGSHSHTITVNSGGSHSHIVSINSSGSGDSGNLQPYITKYVWERTA